MITFKQFLAESLTFPDKLSANSTPEEMKVMRNKIAAIAYGRDYNNQIRIKKSLPRPNSSSDDSANRISAAVDFMFHKKRDFSVDGNHTFYHATRHNVQFDNTGRTTILGLTSTTDKLASMNTYLKKSHKGEKPYDGPHHVLEIKYESGKNVPAVNIAPHSGKSKENEVLFPPFTSFKHVETRDGGIHPDTKKPILIHTVTPSHTHPAYDRDFDSLSKEEKLKRFSEVGR